MEIKIAETYQVASCCPQYVPKVLGENSLLHLSFIVGKVKKTIFPQNFVYVLRTTTTRHMVSFSNFYFHFLAKFQAYKASPHMFSIFTHVM